MIEFQYSVGVTMSVTKIIQPRLHAASSGMFANWMPNANVAVGDFGTIEDHRFVRHGALSEYGEIDGGIEPKKARNSFDYTDRIDLAFSAAAVADTGAGARAKVSVRMADRGAFLYHLANGGIVRAANTRLFHEQLAQILLAGDLTFPDDGVVVTEVLNAKQATVIVADSRDASLELETSFQPLGHAFLAGGQGSVRAGAPRGSVLQFVGQSDINALLRLVRPRIGPPADGPSGPPTQASALEKPIRWFRELFRDRPLKVSDLMVMSHQDANAPHVSIRFAQSDEVYMLTLRELTVEEMLQEGGASLTHDGTDHKLDIEEVRVTGYKERTANG